MESLFDTAEFNERLFFPRRDTSPLPEHASDLRVVVEGAELHLRWHRPLADAPSLLLFHGNGETVSDYDSFAPSFEACGANLAVVDYRGYGSSSGTPTLRRALRDAPLVVAALRGAGAERLVVMGRSLGSASAAELYPRPDPIIGGFIWESGFVDLLALTRRRGLTPPERLADQDLTDFDAIAKLRRGDLPLLVLHGERDAIIDPSEGERAFAAAGTRNKEKVFISGRGHNDLWIAPAYWDAVKRFVAGSARTGA